MEEIDLTAARGFVEPELAEEFPGLRLDWVTVAAKDGKSPGGVHTRLAELSSRMRGYDVVSLRTKPVPRAYRAFFHHIGLDPDTDRTPAEEAAVARLRFGGFRSNGLVADAMLVGLVETNVPVWALDADRVDAGGLGIRTTVEGDRLGLGENAHYLPPGRLAVADSRGVQALLFGDVAAGHGVTKKTRHILLFTIAVDGVPEIHIQEALWLAVEVLNTR